MKIPNRDKEREYLLKKSENEILAGLIFSMIKDFKLLEEIELNFLKEGKNYQDQPHLCKMFVKFAYQARLRIEKLEEDLK